MKKLLIIFSIFVFVSSASAQQQAICCPDFTLQALQRICDKNNVCHADPGSGNGNPGGGNFIVACKNQAHTYLVVPNLTGFSYTWTIIGGTPTSTTGNPVTITWGNSSQGFIQVIVSNGSCRDTIRQRVCLIDGPTASISASPNPTCINQQVCFSSAGSTGAASYFWTFGDGSTSTLPNPCHPYSAPGTYTVTLTVSSSAGGGATGNMPDCGCTDTAQIKITVLNKPGINIYTDDCRKMLCAGDTVKYCTSTTGCSGLNWVVNGGTILGSNTGTCVTVVWNQPSVYPTTVTLNTTSCPASVCGNSATLNVPILYPNLPIQGPNIVCPNAASTYFLPALPGTFYKWTISGGGMIMGVDSNHNVINVQWGPAPGGPFIITCNYNNPYTNCSGTDTIGVFIKPPFKINGPSPVCTGTPAFYNVMGGGNANWTVAPNTGFIPPGPFPNVPNIVLNWSVAGNYTIGAIPTIPANYCTASDSLKIVVNPTPVLNPITGPNIICPNQLYSYSVTSNTTGGNFSWQLTMGTGNVSAYGPNNSNASVNFTGTGPWTLQASQTVNGCTGTITLNISIVPAPPAIAVSPNPVCSGGTVTATVTGPIPPGGYTWSSTPGAVLLTGQGTTTATFTVNSNASISISSCGGTSSVNVTTIPTTVTITSVMGTCNATLTASPGGGTYQWFLNGNPYGTGNPIIVNQNGTYVVSATYAGGCKATNQITVTGITPVTVSISGLGSLCNGGSVTLTASVSANCTGAAYQWYFNGNPSGTGNPISVNTAGNYSVTVTCSNGCTATSNVITVSPCPTGNVNCINDAVISGNNNCNNPINLTASAPGCTPVSYAWLYGDGFGGTTGTHLYTNVGTYNVFVAITCSNGSVHCDTTLVTVPMVDSFTHVISCGVNGWNVQLQDASIYLPAYSGYTRTWSTSCGTLSSTTSPNPTLTVPIGCNPTVTLTISKNGCTLTKSFTFNFPNTAFTINGNVNPCKGVDYVYSSSYTTGVIAYAWNFGDATTGVTNPITHHFNGTPPNPTITLTITDQWGCQFTTTQAVNVIIPPALTITPSPIIKICPDCTTPTTTLTANPSGSFTNYQWYHNGTAITGANSSTYQPCQYDASGNYWVTANNTGTGNCPVISDTVKVVYYPKPVANIQGSTIQCQTGTGPYNINLQNSINDPNYSYFWTATGPGSVTFSPDNLQFYASASATQLGTYQFILTVTDITTGCIAKDTMCVYLYLSPTVTVTAPSNMCEGTNYTFTANATPANPNYIYQWSNGATTQTIIASAPGSYSVTVFDPASGCFGFALAGTINKKPYLALFPLGCDTLCDTAKLIPPLPLSPGQTYPSQYIIKWYVDGNLYFTGCPLLLSGLSLGQHQIYIVVTDITTGCTDTSGKYDLFIKHCGECDCKESHWGDIVLSPDETNMVGLKKFDWAPKLHGEKNANVGQLIKLECNKNYTLLCNQPYAFNASYICKDSLCPPKVTFSLQPPVGSAITGNAPSWFTPTMSGVYTLTLYGWCGNKICDSCIIDLTVKCDTACDCKGSKWGEKTVTINNITKPVVCGTEQVIKCKTPVSINANYICADPACKGSVTYNFVQPSGTTTGNIPPALNFTPSQNGTYSITLYGWCGTTKCDSCVIKFIVKDCPVDSNCCPYTITVKPKEATYTANANSTTVSNNFAVSIPATATITEVRANVVSYTIDDNYKKECMKCVNLPFTWASVASATNIATAPPKITMYGGVTVPSFNGSGTGAYQNPREVIWNNGTNLNLPNITNIGMNFILPPAPGIDCCELKGRICVKFTFRDKDCKECEAIACFDFLIKGKK